MFQRAHSSNIKLNDNNLLNMYCYAKTKLLSVVCRVFMHELRLLTLGFSKSAFVMIMMWLCRDLVRKQVAFLLFYPT